MFTGIISYLARITQVLSEGNHIRLVIAYAHARALKIGQSVAIDGMCVTVTDKTQTSFSCDISPETLSKTICRDYQVGSLVNLELAIAAGERFDGHYVLGHVDGLATLILCKEVEGFVQLQFEIRDKTASRYLISKGSIALNGVSLTINVSNENVFEVMLIPETLKQTNLAELEIGQSVNVEYDYLAKVIVKQYQLQESAIC